MPNWTSNALVIEGTPDDLVAFLARACLLDADALLTLETLSTASTWDFSTGAVLSDTVRDAVRLKALTAHIAAFSYEGHEPMPAELRNTKSPWQRDDDPELWDRYESQYGAVDWYQWANRNWGVKWDASQPNLVTATTERVIMSFASPWCAPFGWLATVAAAHRALTITLGWVDEEATSYGAIIAHAGELREVTITESNETWFWCEIFGWETVPDFGWRDELDELGASPVSMTNASSVSGSVPTGPTL